LNFDQPLDEKLLNLGIKVLVKSQSEEIVENNIFSKEFIEYVDGFYFAVGKVKPKSLNRLNDLKDLSFIALPDYLTAEEILHELKEIQKSGELI
jgi:homoserine dehydrogenase